MIWKNSIEELILKEFCLLFIILHGYLALSVLRRRRLTSSLIFDIAPPDLRRQKSLLRGYTKAMNSSEKLLFLIYLILHLAG